MKKYAFFKKVLSIGLIFITMLALMIIFTGCSDLNDLVDQINQEETSDNSEEELPEEELPEEELPEEELPEEELPEEELPEEEIPEEITQVLSGTVYSFGDYSVVEGATVSAGGVSGVTDSSGNFSLTIEDTVDGAILSVSKEGFGLYSKPMSVSHDREVEVEPHLVPIDMTVNVDPQTDGDFVIETPDGVFIDFPDLAGSGITEELEIDVVYYDITGEEFSSAPGNFQGQETNGNVVDIVSYGMVEVNITGVDTGTEYSFEGAGYDFYIWIPISGDPADAPVTIPLWYYDESTGLWIEQGTAEKDVDDYYVGIVNHFSVWNMDYKLPVVVSAHGTISDPDDDTYFIKLSMLGINRQITTAEKELTIVNLPPDTAVELELLKYSTGKTNLVNFTTPSTGQIELGDLFANNYPFVQNLRLLQENDSLSITWNDPTASGYEGLEINYSHDSGSPSGVTTITPGTEIFNLSSLSGGLLTVVLRAQYTGGNYSGTVTKNFGIGEYSSFTMTYGMEVQQLPEYSQMKMYYSFGENSGSIEYTGPILLPTTTEIQGWVEVDGIIPENLTLEWIKRREGESDQYIGNGNSEFDSQEMDEDLEVILRYYASCGV